MHNIVVSRFGALSKGGKVDLETIVVSTCVTLGNDQLDAQIF